MCSQWREMAKNKDLRNIISLAIGSLSHAKAARNCAFVCYKFHSCSRAEVRPNHSCTIVDWGLISLSTTCSRTWISRMQWLQIPDWLIAPHINKLIEWTYGIISNGGLETITYTRFQIEKKSIMVVSQLCSIWMRSGALVTEMRTEFFLCFLRFFSQTIISFRFTQYTKLRIPRQSPGNQLYTTLIQIRYVWRRHLSHSCWNRRRIEISSKARKESSSLRWSEEYAVFLYWFIEWVWVLLMIWLLTIAISQESANFYALMRIWESIWWSVLRIRNIFSIME